MKPVRQIFPNRWKSTLSLLPLLACSGPLLAQGGAQLRGVVSDPTGAVVTAAKVSVIDTATNTTRRTTTDHAGRYAFVALRPALYSLHVEATGFKLLVRQDISLRVGQQTDLDLRLELGEATTTVDVKGEAPALNSISGALGQEVTNRYVTEVPLLDRNISNLAFLAPGVTQTGGVKGGGGAIDVNQTGTNFVSNGQRNATAEFRLDGGLISQPEEGEGSTTQISYKPVIEAVQEFTLQNNSFSAEHGNNGGTVVSLVTKSGSNAYHATGYWFGRRPQLDANDFFSNRAGQAKPDFSHDQYGASLGGPIVRQKTFFFIDFERVRDIYAETLTTTVPTAAQRAGNFSATFNPNGTLQQLYDPTEVLWKGGAHRNPVAGNIIPASQLDPVALKLASYYPQPTSKGDAVTDLNNFTATSTGSRPDYQFDIKLDQYISPTSRLSGRYSNFHGESEAPVFYQTAADNARGTTQHSQNAVVEHTWTINPRTVWVNRIGVDRGYGTSTSRRFDLTKLGLPSYLAAANDISIFPRVTPRNYGMLGIGGWVDGIYAHTQYQFTSVLSKNVGAHDLRIGGEQRIPFTNYWQPGHPDGWFDFTPNATRERVFGGANANQGNALASMLYGWGNPWAWGGVNIKPGTSSKSKETAFFVQDNWKISSRLTLNLGLRYEWSTPFTERGDRVSFLDPTVDTGISVAGIGRIHGANVFATSDNRSSKADWNNIAPRLGLAYRLDPHTVIRGGAGIYYGMSTATNFYNVAPAYRTTAVWQTSLDGGATQYATLSNPYPDGIPKPQGRKYGLLNTWGFASEEGQNAAVRNAEIYQWSLSLQRELPGSVLVEAAYSANRSTHLPFYGTGNRNFVSAATRLKYLDEGLNEEVDNPFYPLFNGPGAIFNEPSSIYAQETITRINLLRPFPQFDATFEGKPLPVATSRYNALQLRVEKRYSHGLNLVGSYTVSKATDNSSTGANVWLGNYNSIQDPTNLRLEQSLGASDTPQRLVAGWSYELPVGRGRALGRGWSRTSDALLGGWQVNGFVTYQSGLPLAIGLSGGVLADGTQRPDITGNLAGASVQDTVDGKGLRFNTAALAVPAEQIPGTAPRYQGTVRSDSIRNLDLSFFKTLALGEKVKAQLRAEFFNFSNTPRFDLPNTSFGDTAFGTISAQANKPRQSQFGIRVLF